MEPNSLTVYNPNHSFYLSPYWPVQHSEWYHIGNHTLGKMIGTVGPNGEDTSYSYPLDRLVNYLSTINFFDYFKGVLNTTSPDEPSDQEPIEETLSPIDEEKNVLEFINDPTIDYNDAFNDNNLDSKLNYELLTRQQYQINKVVIPHVKMICETLYTQFNGKHFDAFIFSAHGGPKSIDFGPSYYHHFALSAQNLYLLDCLPLFLKKNAKIIFNSCSTGDTQNLPFNVHFQDPNPGHSMDYSGEPIALKTYRYLSKKIPSIEVIASRVIASYTFIYQLSPPNVVFMSKTTFGDIEPLAKSINSAVFYNKDSVSLIDKGKSLLKNKPHYLLNYFQFKTKKEFTQAVLEWEDKFDKNQHQLAKALKYSPPSQEKSGYFLLNAFVRYCEAALGLEVPYYDLPSIEDSSFEEWPPETQFRVKNLLATCNTQGINVPTF